MTVEVANAAVGDASGWPVSAAARERTAMLVADIAGRLGIPIDRDRVLGPETIRAVQRVLARTAPGVVVDGDWGPQSVSALQRSLGVVVDGRFGPQTVLAWQGRRGQAQDGEFGAVTIRALQTVLAVRDRISR